MQTIHKVCLALTGGCVVLLCIGIGIGIVHHTEGKSSEDNSVDFEAYDEDYVGYLNETTTEKVNLNDTEENSLKFSGIFGRIGGGVVDVPTFDQVCS